MDEGAAEFDRAYDGSILERAGVSCKGGRDDAQDKESEPTPALQHDCREYGYVSALGIVAETVFPFLENLNLCHNSERY